RALIALTERPKVESLRLDQGARGQRLLATHQRAETPAGLLRRLRVAVHRFFGRRDAPRRPGRSGRGRSPLPPLARPVGGRAGGRDAPQRRAVVDRGSRDAGCGERRETQDAGTGPGPEGHRALLQGHKLVAALYRLRITVALIPRQRAVKDGL